MKDPNQIMRFKNRQEWRKWLERNHDREDGVWLLLHKKHVAKKGIQYLDALEEALCFGWIDSKLKRVDDETFAQWFSVRKNDSIWSVPNKNRALRLIESEKMAQAGMRKIEMAKANGRWSSARSLTKEPELPDDLIKALRNANATKNFKELPVSRKVGLVFWIDEAKGNETRARRIAQTVSMVLTNEFP